MDKFRDIYASGQHSDESTPVQFPSRFDQNFELDGKNPVLGQGGYGIVFKAKDKLDQQFYAIKRINMPRSSHETREKVLREVQILAKLEHPHIVRYFSAWEEFPPSGWQETWDIKHEISVFSDSDEFSQSKTRSVTSQKRLKGQKNKTNATQCTEADVNTKSDSIIFKSDNAEVKEKSDSYVYIQTQLCHEGTLKDWLEKHNSVLLRERKKILKIFYEITCALNYLHRSGLMHRDLKPSNIFLTTDNSPTNGDCGLKVKLGDFGLVKDLCVYHDGQSWMAGSRRHTTQVGTPSYMSPEQLKKTKEYDSQTDIFSLGLVFLELCQPFKTDSEKFVTFKAARKGNLERLSKELKDERDLLRKMLSSDPQQRPRALDILKHHLLRDFSPKSIFNLKRALKTMTNKYFYYYHKYVRERRRNSKDSTACERNTNSEDVPARERKRSSKDVTDGEENKNSKNVTASARKRKRNSKDVIVRKRKTNSKNVTARERNRNSKDVAVREENRNYKALIFAVCLLILIFLSCFYTSFSVIFYFFS